MVTFKFSDESAEKSCAEQELMVGKAKDLKELKMIWSCWRKVF